MCAAKVPTIRNLHDSDEPDQWLHVRPHLRECQLMSKLGCHQNIVKFMGICILSDYPQLPAMVMEKVEGPGNLHNYLKKLGQSGNNIELTRKRHILQGVANGLYYLHYGCHLGVVHMDLKASIILLTSAYDAKISGFRKSCMVHDEIKACESRYDPEYMPPEVVENRETKCNPTIDIFSFGVLALFTLIQVQCYNTNLF